MRNLTRLLIIMFACWWTAAVSAAGPEDLRRAAEAGDAEAQLELGVLYEYGFGLPKNEVPALAWYALAAEQGHAKAAARRDTLRARLQPAEVEQASALMAQWRVAKPQPAADAPAPTTAPGPAVADTPAPTPTATETAADAPVLDPGAAADILVPRAAP